MGLLLALALAFSAGAASPECPPSQADLEEPQTPVKGIVVLAHGLNQRPDKMGDIVAELHGQGFAVVRAVLRGHEGDLESFKAADRAKWRRDMHGAYCIAKQAAGKGQLPLYFFGYSLGALINTDLMESEPDLGVRYDRMVYLAPPLAVNGASHLVKLLGVFGNGFLVPSFADPGYRASCDGTPMAAYHALFDSIEYLEARSLNRVRATPTLVMCDPEDEMVSWSKLRALADEKKFEAWKFVPVSNSGSTMKSPYHHMIASQEAVGAAEWKRMMGEVRRHFGASK